MINNKYKIDLKKLNSCITNIIMSKKSVTFDTFRDVTYIEYTPQHKGISWWSKDNLLLFKIQLVQSLQHLNVPLVNINLRSVHRYINYE